MCSKKWAKPDLPGSTSLRDPVSTGICSETMFGNPVSTDHKVRVLGRADCLLSAGRRQRTYFYGWLAQAGRLPRDEHQGSALLQHHVGGALDQVVGESVGDRAQRAHAAGTHDHRACGRRAAGDGRRPLLRAEHAQLSRCGAVQFGEVPRDVRCAARQLQVGLRADDDLRRLIHDRAPEHALRAAAALAGTTSLRRDGARWLANGTTSLAELVRVSREA
jgi:hypothetical protein